jgi:hypothetical protein
MMKKIILFVVIFFVSTILNGCMSLEDAVTPFGWFGLLLLAVPFIGIGQIVVGIRNRNKKEVGWGVIFLLFGMGIYFLLFSGIL